MNISVFGLGYVGCVSAGILADLGHNVIGVDTNQQKVTLINTGKSTIVEAEIETLIEKNQKLGRLVATTDTKEAIEKSELGIICVGTPSIDTGHLDMSHIHSVATEIGKYLRDKKDFFTVAIRSTVMPGTNKKVSEIIENFSGKINGNEFAVVSNPEFLREGTAVMDFLNPPYTIIASGSERGIQALKNLYSSINSKIIQTSIGVAELIKFINNSFHALKVDFANEIGRICKSLGVDSRELMDLFVQDTHLNISSYYLKPGFPYGGSCLPKDLKALITIAHDKYIEMPLLQAIEKSNFSHLEHILKQLLATEKKNMGIYGLSFKVGTDDLRFSPAVEIAERLIGKGFRIKVYDKNVVLSQLTGKNRYFLYEKIPHINSILVDDLNEFLKDIEVLLLVNKDEQLNQLLGLKLDGLIILDGTGLNTEMLTNLNITRIC